MWMFIGLFALALVSIGLAPIAARGDARSGYRIWVLVIVLCVAATAAFLDAAFNPAAYHALLRLAGAQ